MACKFDNTNVEASGIVAKKYEEWRSVFYQTFGWPIISKDAIDKEIVKLKQEARLLERTLKTIKGNDSQANAQRIEIQNRIKEIKGSLTKGSGEIKSLQAESRVASKKAQTLQDIHKIIMEQTVKYADSNMYNIDPYTLFPVIKEWMQKQYTIPFNNLHDLDYKTLTSISNKLKSIYSKQDKIIKKNKLGPLQNQTFGPATVMFQADPTGLAFKLIQKTRSIIDQAFSDSAPYKRILKDQLKTINDFVETKQFYFDGAKTLEESSQNVIKRIHEILDGQKRNIKPQAIFTYVKGKAKFTDEFKRDKKEYDKKLRRSIDNGIHDGGDIQSIEISPGDVRYYIPIKRTNADGVETWNAYEVPHKEGNLEYPITNKSPVNKKIFWEEFLGEEGIATQTNKEGRVFQGKMQEGWYEANGYVPLSGERKTKTKGVITFMTQAYDNFSLMEDQASIDDILWGSVMSIRNVLESIRSDSVKAIEDQAQILTKITKDLLGGKGKKFMTVKELNEAVNKVMNIDMNLNFAISDGKVVTMNHFFSEMENYAPYMYSMTDIVLGLVNARDDLQNKIVQEESKYTALKNKNKLKEAIESDTKIKEMNNLISIFDEKIEITLGIKAPHEASKVNTSDLIKFAKHRSGFMSPLASENPDGTIKSNGRRKDFNVFIEYADQMFGNINRNSLKIDTLKAITGVSPNVSNFLIDHVKRSVGRLDVEAGVFGIDYSDTRFARFLTKIKKIYSKDYKVTEEMVYRAGKMHSMFISGSLLRWQSALTNQFQRASEVIESGINSFSKSHAFTTNSETKEIAKEIADLAGTTDTVTALADSLFGAAGADMSGNSFLGLDFSGYGDLKDLAILKLGKRDFVKRALGNKFWSNMMTKLMLRTDDKMQVDQASLENVLNGVWEATHGLAKAGKMSPKEVKHLKKSLIQIMEADKVNKYVGWALSGGILAGGAFGLKEGVGFIPVEIQLRTQATIQGAMDAVKAGVVSQEEIDTHAEDPYWAYKQPEVIRYARLYVYNTMFGMSPAYLPKMFSGFWGTTIWKFKPYQWHQGKAEIRIIENYMRQGGNLMDKVGGIINPKSELDRKMQRFFSTRVFISTATTMLWYAPVISEVMRSFTRLLNPQLGSAMQRGGESVIATAIFRSILMSLAVAGGTDEEDEMMEEWYRLFLPMFMNVAYDTLSKGDPLHALSIYHRGLYNAIDGVRDYISD
jgi:hypothetical protein